MAELASDVAMGEPIDLEPREPFDTRVGDVGPNCLLVIFGFLSGRECGVASCVSGSWRLLLRDEYLWSALCRRDFGLDQRVLPDGSGSSSWRATYAQWSSGYAAYGILAPRAQRIWSLIRYWTARHLPDVAQSLRPGASEADLAAAEAALGFPLPPALRVQYRFCDGQHLQMDSALDSAAHAPLHASMLHGLLGGYVYYDHVVSTRLLPLHRLVRWTKQLQAHAFPPTEGVAPMVLMAASFSFNKIFVVDAESAAVKVCLQDKRCTLDAVPQIVGQVDGVMRWLEEFASRLLAMRYRIIAENGAGVPATLSLSLFDTAQPGAAEAITHGVRVTAMPLFVPEHSRRGTAEAPALQRYFFAYSIRFSLLSVADQKAAGIKKPIKFAQLKSRHWVIRNSTGEVLDYVSGEGVVGQFPLLKAGGGDFSYSSCTNQTEPEGYMEGTFKFSHGSTAHPTGADFDVKCPRFGLIKPPFIF
mmetsp:Transcript_12374/g.37252  ORF Transcript_12374/g.37252 Transcript_12374/m.37252 type:complete len:473 (+) Transcript_12374:86-1504(+)